MGTQQYDNILKAVGADKPTNWDIINKWISEGRDLAEMDRQMSSGTPSVEPALFHAMEQAVKSDPDVRAKRQAAADVKTQIITEICVRDPRYKEALEAYQKAVTDAYLKLKGAE